MGDVACAEANARVPHATPTALLFCLSGTLAVFVVTAFMHGLSPGFYLFFLHLAAYDMIEQAWLKCDLKIPRSFPGAEKVIVVVRHILTVRLFEYIVVPHHLPQATVADCFAVWSTLGYSGKFLKFWSTR